MTILTECIVAKLNETSSAIYKKVSDTSNSVSFPGVAIILDNSDLVVGVATDGDFRRNLIKNGTIDDDIKTIMNDDFFSLVENEFSPLGLKRYQDWQKKSNKSINFVIILDSKGKLKTVKSIDQLMELDSHSNDLICILGMGFVGTTLAAHLVNEGENVIAIEKNKIILDNLRKGSVPHIHEPGLEPVIETAVNKGAIGCFDHIPNNNANIYIVSVGTPVDHAGKVSIEALSSACSEIGFWLKAGDHVMLRSTVPVGTSRNLVASILQDASKLIPGVDFHLTFAPERTVEGVALSELKSLPQIVGSYSNTCKKKALMFWNKICPSVISMQSLEASELVKLANNTFRDLSFAFANELNVLADKYNVNTFELITAANDGYPRNTIARPSPGVGGYCLTKDPFIYHKSLEDFGLESSLGLSSRSVNESAAFYPAKILSEFSRKLELKIEKLNILIIGIAFKGEPETNDARGSVSVDLMKKMTQTAKSVSIFDWTIPSNELLKINPNVVKDLDNEINSFDAVFIMNNHKNNCKIDQFLRETFNNRLVFDGWDQLNQALVEQLQNTEYATLGYSSFRK
jgi:UDP-N-acetyl-D-mannosaminuronic acid dehydrogenase